MSIDGPVLHAKAVEIILWLNIMSKPETGGFTNAKRGMTLRIGTCVVTVETSVKTLSITGQMKPCLILDLRFLTVVSTKMLSSGL
jgi:hypothetical protein